MIQFRQIVSVFALLAVPAGQVARAEPAALLTLEQAVEIALENNGRLLVASAESAIAEAGLEEARAGRMPRVEVTETISRTTNPTLVFSQLLGQESFGADNFAIDRLNQPDALTNFNSKLSVTHPLWTGGRIRNGVAAASLASEATDSTRERTRQEVVHQVINAYTGAVLAASQYEVATEAVGTAKAHVKLVADLREGGLVVESDLLQARVRLSEVEETLIRAEAAVAIAEAGLNLALGRDLGTAISVAEPSAAEFTEGRVGELPLEQLIEQARQARPDLQAAHLSVDAAGRAAKVQRAARRPQIGLTGQAEINSSHVLESDGTNWSIFAGASFTVFDGRATGARIRQAERQQVRAERMRDLLADTVELDVRRAFHDLRAARKRSEQAAGAVALAREALRIVEDRYKEGLTTVVELLDAETALTRSRSRETASRRDIVLAVATLDLAVGRL